LDARNIRANERVADALKDRADAIDRAVKAKAQLAEAQREIERSHEIIIGQNEEIVKAKAQLAEANARSFEHAKAAIADVLMLRTEAELKKLLGPELEAAIARAEAAEAQAAALRAALEEYADRKNWRVSDSSSGYLDRWIGDDGPTMAQAALNPTPAEPTPATLDAKRAVEEAEGK
jgi:protein subunit release factor A